MSIPKRFEVPPSNEYNVVQFFLDGTHEYVRRGVPAMEAGKAFLHYSNSVGARMGTTVRVIVTDGWDCINAEWKLGEGIVFPCASPCPPDAEPK